MQSLVARSLLALSTLALVCSLGCKEEEPTVEPVDYPNAMAEGYCTAVYSCTCDDYPYASINECFADLVNAYTLVNNTAFNAGLVYDGTCPARTLQTIESLACKGYVPPPPEGICQAPCNVWHGQQQAGYPCEVLATSAELGLAFSTCGQGLVCTGGVCVNPCQTGQLLPTIGQPCPQMLCAAGAVCDETTMMCVAEPTLPGPGQPCSPEGTCNPTTAVCVAAAGTCAALPAVGQLCIEGQCDPNGYCSVDDICVAKPPLACGLLGGGLPGDGDGDGDPTTTTGDGDGDGDGDSGCTATAIPSTIPSQWAGDTTDAPAVELGSCGGDGPEDVLTYTAPETGTYVISTEGSVYDTVVYVRQGDCTGAELACNDEGPAAPASQVEVSLTAGEDITIIVDAYGSSGGGYILSVNLF